MLTSCNGGAMMSPEENENVGNFRASPCRDFLSKEKAWLKETIVLHKCPLFFMNSSKEIIRVTSDCCGSCVRIRFFQIRNTMQLTIQLRALHTQIHCFPVKFSTSNFLTHTSAEM